MGKLATFFLYGGPAAVILSACSSAPSTVETVPVSDVLNALKAELGKIHPTAELPPDQNAECSDPDHVVRVVAYPTKAVVDLKTVVTAAFGADGSANIPAGPSGVIVSPSLGASSTDINTQDLKLTLPIQHTPATRADLQTEIASLRKYLTDRGNNKKDLKDVKDPAGRHAFGQIQTALDAATSKLHQDEIELADIESKAPTPYPHAHPFDLPRPQAASDKTISAVPQRLTDETIPAARASRPEPTKLGPAKTGHVDFKLPLAEAFNRAIVGIFETNHTRPCFLLQQMDIGMNFEVVREVHGGVSVTFLVAKIGGNASKKDDATQSITVTFDLSDGSVFAGGGAAGGDQGK